MYEIIMALLAIAAVVIAFLDIAGKIVMEGWIQLVEQGIWLIFVVDFVVRLLRSESKRQFVKGNVLDLIAILPFSALLRVFRIARLIRLARLARMGKVTKFIRFFAIMGRFTDKAKKILHTNGFIYVIYVNVAIVFLGAIGIYLMELGTTVSSFADAIWWSFVTTTTVGYGDISPSSGVGRIIAVVLMLTGIGTIGMLTSTLSTYFLRSKQEAVMDKDEELIEMVGKLTPDQVVLVKQIVRAMRE